MLTVIPSSVEFPPIHKRSESQSTTRSQSAEPDLERSPDRSRVNAMMSDTEFDVTALNWKEKEALLRLLYQRMNGHEFSSLSSPTKPKKKANSVRSPASIFPHEIQKNMKPHKRLQKLITATRNAVPPTSPTRSESGLNFLDDSHDEWTEFIESEMNNSV
jgi:hypothetical protein